MKQPHQTILTVDSFYKDAPKLRSEYDARFANPHKADSDRFIWDYWHIKDQYTLLRTPAYHFFKPRTYAAFHKALLKYGREVLGCYDVTPPWMSCYVEGCSQDLHADVPHGPWAFVFSLTNWSNREFSGGETWMLKPETLQYWHNFSSLRGVERHDLMTEVQPEFNRLTVFDPRLPHGVREVRGVRDPLKGRLVIHG
ncbi:MAG: 2OG-Fe(II) oxygenase, partial [Bdellovibrionota bacterium]